VDHKVGVVNRARGRVLTIKKLCMYFVSSNE